MSWIEIIADRKIREAQDEGQFDDLPGKGQPLNLDADPNVPPEQRAAYRLMKEARVLPEWIEAERQIRQALEQWEAQRDRFLRYHERQRGAALRPEAAQALDRARDSYLCEAAARLRELNRLIDRYNLLVPVPSRQRVRVPARDWMREVEARLPRLLPAPDAGPPAWEAELREERPSVRPGNWMPLRRRRRVMD